MLKGQLSDRGVRVLPGSMEAIGQILILWFTFPSSGGIKV